jgi:hypothetical protein
MSGETEAQQSGWTTDTLHAHVSSLFDAVWRELALLRDRMEHDFQLQAERMDRQWGEQELRTRIALDAHETALNVQRETTLREVATAAKTAKDAVDVALNAQKESVGVQADTLKQYRETQNEWRGSLSDLSARMMLRSEGEGAIHRSTERIQEIVLAQASMVTRVEFDAARAADQVARQVDQERIAALTTRVTQMTERAAGAADKVKAIYAALFVAVAIISFLLANGFLSGR